MTPAPVAAIVLASRGGPRLERALASVAWARERVVLDPARRLGGQVLPRDVGDSLASTSSPWLLLLEEQEAVPSALADVIVRAVEQPAPGAYRIGQDLETFGVTVRLPGAPVRLARRAGARLRLGAGLRLELEAAAGQVGRLEERLLAAGADSLAGALEDLDAHARALAALLHAEGASPRIRHLAFAPLLPGARALVAPGAGRGLWPRWPIAVLAGYRTAVAYAKLWEIRRMEGAQR